MEKWILIYRMILIAIFTIIKFSFCTMSFQLSYKLGHYDVIFTGEFISYDRQNLDIPLFCEQGIYTRKMKHYEDTKNNVGDIVNSEFKITKVLRGEHNLSNIKLPIAIKKGWFLAPPYLTQYQFEDWNPLLDNKKGILCLSYSTNKDSILEAGFIEKKNLCYEETIRIIKAQNQRKINKAKENKTTLQETDSLQIKIEQLFGYPSTECRSSEIIFLDIGYNNVFDVYTNPFEERVVGKIDSIIVEKYDTLNSSHENYLGIIPYTIIANYTIFLNIKKKLSQTFKDQYPIKYQRYYIPGIKIPLPPINKEKVFYMYKSESEKSYIITNHFSVPEYFENKIKPLSQKDSLEIANYKYFFNKLKKEKSSELWNDLNNINQVEDSINIFSRKIKKLK